MARPRHRPRGPRLHKAAHYARKALGHQDAVVLNAETVRLYPHDDVDIDGARFQQSAVSAIADGALHVGGARVVGGGELLPQDLYEPWAEQPRLHRSRLHTELLHQAEDWHQVLAADSTNEPAHLALAHAYLERGDRPAALRQTSGSTASCTAKLGLGPSQRALESSHSASRPWPSTDRAAGTQRQSRCRALTGGAG